MDQCAIETALHDFSQVQIPPDWVAPAPPSQLTWEQDPTYQALRAANSGENYHQDFTHLPWAFTPHHVASSSTFPHPTPLRQRHTDKASTIPPSEVIWNTVQSLPSAGTADQSLPPLLKIRVHDAPPSDALHNPSCTPGPSALNRTFKSKSAAKYHSRPGAWAFELLNPSTEEKNDLSIWSRPSPLPPIHVKPPPMWPSLDRTLPLSASNRPSPSPALKRPLISPLSNRDRGVPTGMMESSGLKTKPASLKIQRKRKRKDAVVDKGKQRLIVETEGEKKSVIACGMCRFRKLK